MVGIYLVRISGSRFVAPCYYIPALSDAYLHKTNVDGTDFNDVQLESYVITRAEND